jgi:NAD-dependent dihydropyrimidine dehydrogenase PreA subunit
MTVAPSRPEQAPSRADLPRAEQAPSRAETFGPTASARPASCSQEPGFVVPIVDFGSCEGKGDCVRVCPENVFVLRRIDDEDYRELGFLQKIKQRVHGMKVAYTPNADACRGCSLCVSACPEHAITLRRAAIRP